MRKKEPSEVASGNQDLVRVEVRLRRDTISALDAWRKGHAKEPSRSEAIRQIIEGALGNDPGEVLPSPDRLKRVIR